LGLHDVSNILWRERHLLELLLFKLEEEQLVLASGRSRWLSHATGEVEMVLQEIKETELARSVEIESLGRDLGLRSNASLRDLAEAVDEPWRSVLLDHRAAFLTVTEEIVDLAKNNRELLARGYQAAREVLGALGEQNDDVELYSARGTTTTTARRSSLIVDEAL
jgi:hypothetical protein